jgi:hypothetical protein
MGTHVHDIIVANHGSILILTGISDAGKAWIEEHLIEGNPEIQFWCKGIVVEPRYVEDIVFGTRNDGLEVG